MHSPSPASAAAATDHMAASRQAQSGPVRPSAAASPSRALRPSTGQPRLPAPRRPGCECLGARAESRQALTRDLHPTPLADWGAPGDCQQMGQGGPSPVTWESPKAGRRVHGAQLGSGAALGLGTPPPSTHSSPLRLQKGACPQGAGAGRGTAPPFIPGALHQPWEAEATQASSLSPPA